MELDVGPEEKAVARSSRRLDEWRGSDQNPVSVDRGEDFTLVDGLGKI